MYCELKDLIGEPTIFHARCSFHYYMNFKPGGKIDTDIRNEIRMKFFHLIRAGFEAEIQYRFKELEQVYIDNKMYTVEN